ncbi:MAG: hypothetical protein IJZ29_05920 [Clostridia bacterium]|nr:hypothetical protein [Clostridia bacterium]
MTIREKVAEIVNDLYYNEKKSIKEISSITGLSTPEIQNIFKNDTPNLRYVTVLKCAIRLNIKVEDYLIDKQVIES